VTGVQRFKIKFLTVIWGDRYIEEFARVSLPSYLAEGNLPALARDNDFEVLVLTSEHGRQKFDAEPAFRRLRTICPVRFIYIDDLITTGVYGVTLTLAYARGIMDSGAAQTDTYFIFMNSDFVLADGSLGFLADKLREGWRCIMAPSLRARAEDIVPTLAAAVRDGTLSVAPRQMVAMALKNLHATVIGKTVTQNFVNCSTHNQLYWQVDRDTLLGRYHLIFMLAIRPEVPMGGVNSYCDYGFVPELVPSGQFTILGDSDDLMMLELQPAAQEKQFLRCGGANPTVIAKELSVWTTREHRQFAQADVVFHVRGLPSKLPRVRAEAAQFVGELHRAMTPEPRTHVDHFFWAMGLQAWMTLKYAGEEGRRRLPPELAPSTGASSAAEPRQEQGQARRVSLRQRYIDLIGRVRELAGVFPNVPVWHHLWLDSRLLLRWVRQTATAAGGRSALICGENSPLAASLPKLAPFEVSLGIDDFVAAQTREEPRGQPERESFDRILIQVRRTTVRRTRAMLQAVAPYLKQDGIICLYIRHENAELDPSDFTVELSQYVEEVLPADWLGWNVQASFVGGPAKRHLRLAERYLFRYLMPSSAWRVPLLLIALGLWPIVAALTALNNYRSREPTSPESYCTSALLILSKLPDSGTDTPALPQPEVFSARHAAE
jgi:hypothetical protein